MFNRISDVSLEEFGEIKEAVDQMNQRAAADHKAHVLRLRKHENGSVGIALNDEWGKEGLDLLNMVLRRLERFQK